MDNVTAKQVVSVAMTSVREAALAPAKSAAGLATPHCFHRNVYPMSFTTYIPAIFI